MVSGCHKQKSVKHLNISAFSFSEVHAIIYFNFKQPGPRKCAQFECLKHSSKPLLSQHHYHHYYYH